MPVFPRRNRSKSQSLNQPAAAAVGLPTPPPPPQRSTPPPAAPPQRPHPAMMQSSRIDGRTGHVMDEDEQEARAERRKRTGLCPIHPEVKTHNILFGMVRQPIKEGPNVLGGKCLRCNSRMHVRSMLNQPVDDYYDVGYRQSVTSPPRTLTASGQRIVGLAHDDVTPAEVIPPRQENPRNVSFGAGGDVHGGYGGQGEHPSQVMHGEHSHGRYGEHPSHGRYSEYPPQGGHGMDRAPYQGGHPMGEYYSAHNLHQQQVMEARPPDSVPSVVGPGPRMSAFPDDVSVISMDPSIMTTDSGTSNHSGSGGGARGESERNLERITEELTSADVSSSSQDRDFNSTRENINRNHSRTLSSGSATNNSGSRVGATSVQGDDGFTRILTRKLADNPPAPPRPGGHQAPQPGPPPAPPVETSHHVHFSDNYTATPGTAQTVRPGTLLHQRLQVKQEANSVGHARSRSEGHSYVPSRTDQKGHARSMTHGEAPSTAWPDTGDECPPNRQMSSGGESSKDTASYDGNTRTDTVRTPGAQSVMTGGGKTIYERKIEGESGAQSVMTGGGRTIYERKIEGESGAQSVMTGGGKTIYERKIEGEAGAESVITGGGKTIYERKVGGEVGAHDMKSGEGKTIYQRKIDADVRETHGVKHERRPTIESMPESDARSLIANCSSCVELMDALKEISSSTQAVILLALRKVRDCLPVLHGVSGQDHHTADPMAFPNSSWAKTVTVVMSSQSNNAIIQSELLHTIWSIVTLHPRYISHLLDDADIQQIATTMEIHSKEESVQEYGCGLIACIAASQKQARRLRGEFIQRLMVALTYPGRKGNVQANALKALFRLSSAYVSSDSSSTESSESPTTEFFASKMGRYIIDSHQVGDSSVTGVIDAVLRAMRQYIANASVQVHGNRLLWNIICPDAIVDEDMTDIMCGKVSQHIKRAQLYHKNSRAFHETAACLLSKMSSFGNDTIQHDTFSKVVVETMKAEPKSGVVALHGCRCFANKHARSSSLAQFEAANESITVIISCMDAFQDHVAIQAEACAALSAMCRNSPANKETVHRMNGIERINRAYDSFSVTPYEDHCLETKKRACIALTTLAVDPIILSDLQGQGVIKKFERLVREDPDMPADLRNDIQALLDLVPDDDEEWKLVFREGANEEEMCDCVRANLRALATEDFTPNRLAYLKNNTLRAMQQFPTCSFLHENGCKLLASLFDLASDDEPAFDPDSHFCLEVMAASLAEHRNSPENTAAACSALQNFCIFLSLSSFDDNREIADALSRALAEEAGALIIHREDERTTEQIIGALWSLCAVKPGLALSFNTNSTVGLVVGAMDRFPASELQRHSIGLLSLFFLVSNRISDFINDEMVDVVIRFIDQEINNADAADLVDTALNMILIMTTMGFRAIETLHRNERLIETVVGCMMHFQDSLSIQGAGIDILSNVAVDNYLRADVCQRGGTSRIIAALDNLRDDPVLVTKSFAALSNLVSGADIEILRSQDRPATRIFVQAMTAHPDNLSIQIGAARALWALSAKSETFKDEIVNLNGAEAIANAMARFVGSRDMQTKGCVTLWSLSVPRHLKMRVGRCTAEPLVDGLSAHILSANACEEALGCLKCLSTIAVNKELFEDEGAVDLIYSCIWMHGENASVCKAALSALCNVSVNVDTNEVSEISSADLDAVVYVMRTHSSVREVQESAIILLRNFTFSHTNLDVMGRNRYLVPLVRSAMSNHNTHYQGRADDLLRVLPR